MIDFKKFSDRELSASLKQGEEGAITEIYRRYWSKLLPIAYNHTHEKQAAQEIVQEVLVRLWDRRESLEIESLSNYLAMAVKYAVLQALQKDKRRTSIANSITDTNASNDGHSQIDAIFLQQYINGVVEQLPEKCRLVFKYSREKGKSVAEIGAELHMANKTVEAHLTKALKTLRYALKGVGLSIIVYLFINTM
jgi:RNA polymerase sigma-70 factor (family 1)